jgi:DNA-binding protein HU-beta
MTKRDITHKMAKDAGITALQAEKAFRSMMSGIKEALIREERVTFSGFGSFEIKHRKGRRGRNPKTGETIQVPPKKRVKFIPSNILKSELY